MEQPLSDIKVLDLTWYIAGPYCTKLLADYGADVIKVEKPGEGEPARMLGPFLNDEPHPEKSALFLYNNTSKRGITLNIDTAQGIDALKRLIKWADVFIDGLPFQRLENLGLSWESISDLCLFYAALMPPRQWPGQPKDHRDSPQSIPLALSVRGRYLQSVSAVGYPGCRHEPESIRRPWYRPGDRYDHRG